MSALARAHALVDVGRYDEALAAAQDALAADPQSSEAACLAAQCQLGLGRHRQAVAAADTALAIDPEDEWALRIRASALRELGRHADAVATAGEAVRVAPDLAPTWNVLFNAQMSAKRWNDARETSRHMLSHFPDVASTFTAQSRLALRDKDWVGAERACRTALGIDPENQVALHNLGVALDMQKRRDEAVAVLTQAARSDPEDERTRKTLHEVTQRFATGAGVSVFVLAQAIRLTVKGVGATGERVGYVLALVALLVYLAGYAGYRRLVETRLAEVNPSARMLVRPTLRRRDVIAMALFTVVAGALGAAAASRGRTAVSLAAFAVAAGTLVLAAGQRRPALDLGRLLGPRRADERR